MARAMHEAGVRPLTGATVNAETRTAPGRRVLTRSRPCARHWRFPEPCVGRRVSVCESRGQRQRRKGLGDGVRASAGSQPHHPALPAGRPW